MVGGEVPGSSEYPWEDLPSKSNKSHGHSQDALARLRARGNGAPYLYRTMEHNDEQTYKKQHGTEWSPYYCHPDGWVQSETQPVMFDGPEVINVHHIDGWLNYEVKGRKYRINMSAPPPLPYADMHAEKRLRLIREKRRNRINGIKRVRREVKPTAYKKRKRTYKKKQPTPIAPPVEIPSPVDYERTFATKSYDPKTGIVMEVTKYGRVSFYKR